MKTFITLFLISYFAAANNFHVATKGKDTNAGTEAKPFATIEKACEVAKGKKDCTIFVHGGTYVINNTIILTPEHNGLTICAFKNEKPVFIGGFKISGWKLLADNTPGINEKAKGKIWVADVPKGKPFHYLYINDVAMPRAKLHNTHWREWSLDFIAAEPDTHGQFVTFKDTDMLQNIPVNTDVEMVCIMAQYGVMGNGVLNNIDSEMGTAVWNSNQTYLGFRKRDPNRFTLENALPFIDIPGEWAVNSKLGKVYLWSKSGNMNNVTAIAPKIYEMIRIQGDEKNGKIAKNINIKGLTLAYTDRLPEDKWLRNWIVRQWEHPDGMIYVEDASDCNISDNRLLFSGSTGITLNQYCQNISIVGNEIANPGSNGVFLCGYGPGTLDVNNNNTISRNWIHDMGQGNYWHSNAIQIFQSGENKINLNLLQRSAYSCISIVGVSEGYFNNPNTFFRDNEIDKTRQFKEWAMFGIRSEDFSKEIQDGVRNKTYKFDRETAKPYLHSRNNIIENNIVVQPEQLLDEGGAIYAYWCGKGNVWKENLIYKSSGMPGSSILALDDVAEYFTITGNVIWVNGSARCGTVGMRPNERGNVINNNIRASYVPEHADGGGGNVSGIDLKFYSTDATREAVYTMQKTITDKVNAQGGWLGNPDTCIPLPNEEIKDAQQRTLPEDAHVTIE